MNIILKTILKSICLVSLIAGLSACSNTTNKNMTSQSSDTSGTQVYGSIRSGINYSK